LPVNDSERLLHVAIPLDRVGWAALQDHDPEQPIGAGGTEVLPGGAHHLIADLARRNGLRCAACPLRRH
jgi:hypothetical protein